MAARTGCTARGPATEAWSGPRRAWRRRWGLEGAAWSWVVAVTLLAAGCDRDDTTEPPKVELAEASPEAARADGAGDSAADGAEPSGAGAEPEPEPEPYRPPPPPSADQAGSCPEQSADDLGILVSPRRPAAGQPMRVLAASLDDEAMLAMRIETVDGEPVEADFTHYGGVPAATIARLDAPAVRTRLRITVGRDGKGLGCRSVRVGPDVRRKLRPVSSDGVWPVDNRWDAAEEALYSAWLRELFHAPRGEELAWSALHEVTTDPERNLLHDHFAWGEDSVPTEAGLYLRPDCADTPYFLRAYFAWKRGLPFGFRICSRGGAGRAPSCGQVRGVLGRPAHEPDARLPGELGAVQKFFKRTLAWGVHTGNGRTAFEDEETDFYPLQLTRRSLRPGVIYADPYGHIFVVAEMMPPQGDEPGILYAIDGQPDGSITRKRFWEGNFLWNPDPALGGSGFKGFRPHLRRETESGPLLMAATDAELAKLSGYGDLDRDQAKLDAPAFYDHMDGLITPGVRDPGRAQEQAIVALFESARVRLTSVDNGWEYITKSGDTIDMPQGFSIFETTGAWENFSTPARDLRLLIAIDVATGFPQKVARNPDAWGVEAAGGLDAVRERLQAQRTEQLADPELSFRYTRSDGSTWTLTLADLVERAPAFEVAYNPNDCPEVRWGAPKGSEERSTCVRRAPEDQRRKMVAYRPWFHERRRPPRGDPGPPVE